MKLCIPVAVSLALMASFASAAVQTLDTSGRVTRLEDTDYEALYNVQRDANGDPVSGSFFDPFDPASDSIVGNGDILFGIFQMDSYAIGTNPPSASQDYNGTTGSFTGVFAAKVSNTPTPGFATQYTFAALTDAEWAMLWADIGVAVTRQDSNSIVIVHDTFTLSGGADEFLLPESATLAGAMSSALTGTQFIELGIDLAFNATNNWTATAIDAVGATNDASSISNIDSLNFTASLSVTHQYAAAQGIQFLNVDGVPAGFGTPTGTGQFLPSAQVHLQGNLDEIPDLTGPIAQNFQIKTDSNFYLRAYVPEPSALFVWSGIGAMGLCVVALRKSRQSSRVS